MPCLSLLSLIWAVQWLRGWHQQRKTKFKGTENWVIFPEWPSAYFVLSHDIGVIKKQVTAWRLWKWKRKEKKDVMGISPWLTGFHVGETYGSLQSNGQIPTCLYLPLSGTALPLSPEPKYPGRDSASILNSHQVFVCPLFAPITGKALHSLIEFLGNKGHPWLRVLDVWRRWKQWVTVSWELL